MNKETKGALKNKRYSDKSETEQKGVVAVLHIFDA